MGEIEKLGIDVLEKDLVVLAKLTGAIDKALEDDKISTGEWIGIGFKAVDLVGVFKNIKKAKAQLMNLDLEEKEQLKSTFVKEFDISNDKVEEVVESIIVIAIDLAVGMELIGGNAKAA